MVHDQRFRTKAGVGVGSSLRDVRAQYPVQIASGEGATAALVKSLELSFVLSTAAPTDGAIVTSVRVVADPARVRARWCAGR